MGKLYELEPEPEFLTSWSRSRSWSRTKMDRLRNTGCKYGKYQRNVLKRVETVVVFSFPKYDEQNKHKTLILPHILTAEAGAASILHGSI
jgi:hypothetical protein